MSGADPETTTAPEASGDESGPAAPGLSTAELLVLAQERMIEEFRARIARGEALKPGELKLLGQLEAQGVGRVAARNLEELAGHLGVSARTVKRWNKVGMPREPDGTYDVERVRVWREAQGNRNGHRMEWERGTDEVPRDPEPARIGDDLALCPLCEPLVRESRAHADYWDAQDKYERALTRRVKRRAIEGELVPASVVERDRVARALRLRADFEGWAYEFPLRLVQRFDLGAGAIPEIRRLVMDAGREWLGRYAEDREYVTEIGDEEEDEGDGPQRARSES